MCLLKSSRDSGATAAIGTECDAYEVFTPVAPLSVLLNRESTSADPVAESR